MKNCLLSFLFFLLLSMTAMAQTPVQKIPEFLFYRLDQKPFTKREILPGKKVLFVFFDADCDHCQNAMKAINLHYKEFNKAEIYLVTLDNTKKISNFMNTYGPALMNKLNVTILQDLRNEFIVDFSPRKYPSMLLFSANGQLLMYQDDPNNISQIFKLL